MNVSAQRRLGLLCLSLAGCGLVAGLDDYGAAAAGDGGAGGTASGAAMAEAGHGSGGAPGGRGGASAQGGAGGEAGAGGEKAVIGTLLLPPDASTEGNSGNSSPFGETKSQRFQSVYGEGLLVDLPIGSTLVGMRYRLNGGEAAFEAEAIDDFEIRLSTSANPPGSLSETLAENRGPDEILLRDGPYSIQSGDYPSSGSPNGFGPLIPFSKGFTYNGGPILMEVAITSASSPRQVDNIYPADGNSETAYGTGFDAVTADQGLFTDLIVVELTYLQP